MVQLKLKRGSENEKLPLYSQYHKYRKQKIVFLFVSIILLLFLVIFAASTGSIKIPFSKVLNAIFTLKTNGTGRIVWDVRMPRILAALLVGGGLSLSGTVMQSVLRNQLASPYTLGLSSAAAFGASFAIIFFDAGTGTTSTILVSNSFAVAASAFGFCLLSTLAILLLTVLTNISAESMVLAGIAIGSLFSAGLTLMQYLADSVQLASIVSWTFGDLGRAKWQYLVITALALIPVCLLFFNHRWDFNALDTGEETAIGLGVKTGTVRVLGMLASSFLSAIIVSFFGTIAFIGLLGPHIARRILGSDHRFLLVSSPVIGAFILLAADTAARTVLQPMILPVGILTSLLGGPLFIYLLIAGRNK
ncbi:MAG: iron ABC transporter permease [Spirochaetales bacterium]|nr:iron ABC transporter permease [Spirochaetales bacterium]